MELTKELITEVNIELNAGRQVSPVYCAVLEEHAKPDCRGCDGYGIFYGNVGVCPCVREK